MKKHLVIFLVLFINQHLSLAQSKDTTSLFLLFDKNKDSIYYERSPSICFNIPFKITGKLDTVRPIYFEIDSTLSTIQFKDISLQISQHKLNTQNNYNDTLTDNIGFIIKSSDLDAGIKNKELVLYFKDTLGIKTNIRYFKVKFTTTTNKAFDPSYGFITGGNFSFKDGISPENFYYELYINRYKAFENSKNCFFKRLGFLAGFYQNRNFIDGKPKLFDNNTYPVTDNKQITFQRLAEPLIQSNDSGRVIKETLLYDYSVTTKSTGLYFDLLFYIGGGSSNKIFATLNFDYINRNLVFDYTYKTLKQDTSSKIYIPTEDISKYILDRPTQKIISIHEHYQGLGLYYRFADKDYAFDIAGNTGISHIIYNNLVDRYWYYHIWASFNDLNYGFSIGFETRSGFSNGTSPYWTVYVGKAFNISKIAELAKL